MVSLYTAKLGPRWLTLQLIMMLAWRDFTPPDSPLSNQRPHCCWLVRLWDVDQVAFILRVNLKDRNGWRERSDCLEEEGCGVDIRAVLCEALKHSLVIVYLLGVVCGREGAFTWISWGCPIIKDWVASKPTKSIVPQLSLLLVYVVEGPSPPPYEPPFWSLQPSAWPEEWQHPATRLTLLQRFPLTATVLWNNVRKGTRAWWGSWLTNQSP